MTKIFPNVRVNFPVRFASEPLFRWVMTGNPLELFRQFFGAVRASFWPCEAFLAPDDLLYRASLTLFQHNLQKHRRLIGGSLVGVWNGWGMELQFFGL